MLLRRHRLGPIVEIFTVATLIAVAVASYFFINRHGNPEALLSPRSVAALLVANLVPAMALMVLIALVNRYLFVPAISGSADLGLRNVVRGTIAEIGLSAAVIGLVSAFATFDPN